MPFLLFSDVESCIHSAAAFKGQGFEALHVLLTTADSVLAESLRAGIPDLLVLDVASGRFGRLNFDAITLLILDLPEEFLLSAAGRRLVEALGRLARESLVLALIGESVALAGGAQLDGVHAGLSLVPGTAVIPSLQAVNDLRGLLARLSQRGVRLLALDAPVGVCYDAVTDRVAVEKSRAGVGSVLLVTFVAAAQSHVPTARLHVLTPGMEAGWPG